MMMIAAAVWVVGITGDIQAARHHVVNMGSWDRPPPPTSPGNQ
jgi:hypothetical protein